MSRHLNLAKDTKARRPLGEREKMLEELKQMIETHPNLQSLDISNWGKVDSLRCLRPLSSSLTSLILYDVTDLHYAINTICKLFHLEVLDLSQSNRETGFYPKPATSLFNLITSLPYLSHLDISSTNLATPPSKEDYPDTERPGKMKSEIYGLRFLRQPLEFLGLFNSDSACHYKTLPAKKISGDADEDQVITAIRAYSKRADLLRKVIKKLTHKLKNEYFTLRRTEVLELVLTAMEEHRNHGKLLLEEILSELVMDEDDLDIITKRRVCEILLSILEEHMRNEEAVNKSCLMLTTYLSKECVLCTTLFENLMIALKNAFQVHRHELDIESVPAHVISLLIDMTTYGSEITIIMGKFQVIELTLQYIETLLKKKISGEIMELSWGLLMSLTDETPSNCEIFLKAHGLATFEHCFNEFKSDRESHVVMYMVTMASNITEVNSLRGQLMKDAFIRIFTTCLTLVDDSNDIPFFSAQVLANLVNDGPEAWKPVSIKRDGVMQAIVKSCSDWQLDMKTGLTYKSLQSIFHWIRDHGESCIHYNQHWAVRKLADLTSSTKANKYCRLVVDEGGESLLLDFINSDDVVEETKPLAMKVLEHIGNWKQAEFVRRNEETGGFSSEFLTKFKSIRILGRGGFGCVFEAQNLLDEWKYAVKRIHLRGSTEAVNKALKEVRTLASFKHEGIVGYNYSWIEKPPKGWQSETDDFLFEKLGSEEINKYDKNCMFIYIQMELCKGPLDKWLSTNLRRDLNQAKSWFKQLASAIDYLHKNKKIHRDLKPGNILFDENGRLKICDLGLIAECALRSGVEIDISRTVAGTRMYMAPEQYWGNYTSKVDIFSLGLILAEICVYMDFEEAYEVFKNYQGGRQNNILKHLPEVDEFVSWLTNVDPNKRPNSEEILAHKFLA